MTISRLSSDSLYSRFCTIISRLPSQFHSDPEFSEQMTAMMHRHKAWMEARLAEGVASGRIRSGIPSVTLFRLIVGPVRMLFKQWGMSGMKFDLRAESGRLLDALELLLKT